MRPATLPAIQRWPHGVRSRYVSGCRCDECRRANTEYQKARDRAKRRGEWNGLVPATKARRHILRLRKAGVGRDTVADITGIAVSSICGLANGTRRHLRASSERALLAVTVAAGVNDATLVPAGDVLRRLEALRLEEGWSGSELARRLGYQSHHIQFGQTITAKSVQRLERFIRARLVEREAEREHAESVRRLEAEERPRTAADLPFFLRPCGELAEREARR